MWSASEDALPRRGMGDLAKIALPSCLSKNLFGAICNYAIISRVTQIVNLVTKSHNPLSNTKTPLIEPLQIPFKESFEEP